MHKPSAVRTWTSAALAVSAAGLCAMSLLAGPATAQSQQPVIYLDQAWSQADRETYYQISQGSAVVSYDIFLNLEVAGSQELFRSDANSDRYGLIIQTANPRTNPDGLPIGLSKTVVEQGPWKGEHIGLTCAPCHNAQLSYKGKRMRIEGGVGNTFDLMAYVNALDDALQATLADPAKFDRLAARARRDQRGSEERAAQALRERSCAGAPLPHPHHRHAATAGPSRMDAISLIVNRLTTVLPDIPENWSTPVAPTKPPFLWNAPQGSWTQWRGVQQDPIDRNLIETMGVFMSMNLHAKTPAEGLFDSNAALLQSAGRRRTCWRAWRRRRGRKRSSGRSTARRPRRARTLFVTHCAGCHNAWPYTWTEPNKYGKRFVLVGLVPQKYVGTDPGQFEDRPAVRRSPRNSRPNLPPPFKDKRSSRPGSSM